MSKTTIPTGGLADAAVTTAKITDANITTAKIADDAVTSAKSTANITVADLWRVTSGFTNSADPISSNWERADTYGFGQLGTGMTQSSGIFTFPSTGIYRISFHVYFYLNGDDRLMETKIKTTTNNSDYNFLSDGVSFIQQTGGALTYANSHNEGIFDVTDTSTHKCAFRVNVSNSSTQISGDSNISGTYVTFIRLGDT
jgi:hypothetical protein